MTAGAWAKITDLDAIVPVEQGEICCELGRLKVKEGNAPRAARSFNAAARSSSSSWKAVAA